ncbi:MAG TPA: class I SAM-dependent methyltransferase [Candidatus Didemnitutus sp.]|nr:class I SAM-dependent methyltransferase [Candidatus Didemnitutus sp.]
MDEQLKKYESKVKTEWLDDATCAAWRKWHDKSVVFWSELTRAQLEVSALAPGLRVLDLASGTGDPALEVARRVGPTGHVVISDLSPQMLDIAREQANHAGLSNLSYELVDAHHIPFPDASFDRVTCRLGVMFFWDCQLALREIRRVLKPGGIVSFVAWGPIDRNEYMQAVTTPFSRRQPLPPPQPGAPHPARFGKPGSLSAELEAAGFTRVAEESLTVSMRWPGPPEELWTRQYEISAPLRPYFNSFAPADQAAAIKEVIAEFHRRYDGRNVVAKTAIVVASAAR